MASQKNIVSQEGFLLPSEEQLEKITGTGVIDIFKGSSEPKLLRTPSDRIATTQEDASRGLDHLAEQYRGSKDRGKWIQAVPQANGTYHIAIHSEPLDNVTTLVRIG